MGNGNGTGNGVIGHVREHKVPYLVSLLVPVLPLVVAVWQQDLSITNKMQAHHLTEEHPKTVTRLSDIEKKVNLSLELQLANEIHDLMRRRCIAHNTEFDRQLERLQKAYKELTGTRYPQVDCDEELERRG